MKLLYFWVARVKKYYGDLFFTLVSYILAFICAVTYEDSLKTSGVTE